MFVCMSWLSGLVGLVGWLFSWFVCLLVCWLVGWLAHRASPHIAAGTYSPPQGPHCRTLLQRFCVYKALASYVFIIILSVKSYALSDFYKDSVCKQLCPFRFWQGFCLEKAMRPLSFYEDSVCKKWCCKKLRPLQVFTMILPVKSYATPLGFHKDSACKKLCHSEVCTRGLSVKAMPHWIFYKDSVCKKLWTYMSAIGREVAQRQLRFRTSFTLHSSANSSLKPIFCYFVHFKTFCIFYCFCYYFIILSPSIFMFEKNTIFILK